MTKKGLEGVVFGLVFHLALKDFHRSAYRSQDGRISYVVDEPTAAGRKKGLKKESCYYYGTVPCRNIAILKKIMKKHEGKQMS